MIDLLEASLLHPILVDYLVRTIQSKYINTSLRSRPPALEYEGKWS